MSVLPIAPGPEVEHWVRNSIAADQPIRFQALTGATSASLFTVVVAGSPRFVLRLFTNHDWLGREPDLADHEAAALTHAERAALPAPRLIATASGAECGVPAVLMTYLPGHVDLRPRRRKAWLTGLAHTLVQIHHTDIGHFPWGYRSWNAPSDGPMPLWLNDPALWARAREIETLQPPAGQARFLHRDYHPANVLWSDAEVSGVVDWVNACTGPAGVDVAHCRINLALMYGVRDADDFLRAYVAVDSRYQHHPHWDIDAAMNWGLADPHYYPPWRDFGLRQISQALLRERMREFLQSAVARA